MKAVGDRCERAHGNVRAGVDPVRRFPRNIFVGAWADFVFFDSDWMRQSDFVEHVKTMLALEGGECACLWKLDADDPNGPSFFFVREQTNTADYGALLAGPAPGYGWLDAMERLVCASDSGAWCMYCEPNNEIAVIAFRHSDGAQRYSSAIARVHAERFEDATREPPLSYGFSALSREWRDQFAREYAARSL